MYQVTMIQNCLYGSRQSLAAISEVLIQTEFFNRPDVVSQVLEQAYQ